MKSKTGSTVIQMYWKVRRSAVPCEKTGESIKLFIVPNEKEVDIESLKAHCREGLTAYKIPREFVLIDDIPKSIIGKILHRELRDKS